MHLSFLVTHQILNVTLNYFKIISFCNEAPGLWKNYINLKYTLDKDGRLCLTATTVSALQKNNECFTPFLSTGYNPWLSGFWFLGCTLGRELPQLPPALTEFKKKAVPGCSPVSKSPTHPSVVKQYPCIYCTPTFLFQSALRFCHIVDVVIGLYTWCNVATLPSYFNTGQHCTQQLSWTWTQQTTTLLELENVSHPVILPTYMTRIWCPVASGLKFLCLFSL